MLFKCCCTLEINNIILDSCTDKLCAVNEALCQPDYIKLVDRPQSVHNSQTPSVSCYTIWVAS